MRLIDTVESQNVMNVMWFGSSNGDSHVITLSTFKYLSVGAVPPA